MKKLLFLALALVMAFTLVACGSNNNVTTNSTQQAEQSATPSESTQEATKEPAAQTPSSAGSELVKFPENYAEGVLYATVERGNIREEIFTSREPIDAVKNGQPIPSGTVITLVDYRDGKLFRYVVMEKRNGEWEYQAFNADKSVNQNENLDRCFSCHKLAEQQDFVYTLDQMKSVK